MMNPFIISIVTLLAATSSLANTSKEYLRLQKIFNESISEASSANEILPTRGASEDIFNCVAVSKDGAKTSSLMTAQVESDAYQFNFERYVVPKRISLIMQKNGVLVSDSIMGITKAVSISQKYSRGIIGKFKTSGIVSDLYSEYIFRCVGRR